jgi:hypothetical protein
MRRALLLISALLLAGCERASHDGNSSPTATAVEQATDQCVPPALALADGDRSPASALLDETRANFAAAHQRACDKGLLREKALIDPKATDQGQLFLINAPDANVASVYLSEVDGNRMVLEYPFLTGDGKTHVPSADELEEAIYCTVVGATAEEQERSGRCLVD